MSVARRGRRELRQGRAPRIVRPRDSTLWARPPTTLADDGAVAG